MRKNRFCLGKQIFRHVKDQNSVQETVCSLPEQKNGPVMRVLGKQRPGSGLGSLICDLCSGRGTKSPAEKRLGPQIAEIAVLPVC